MRPEPTERPRLPPVHAGILIGGRSTRMGRPKAALVLDGVSLLDRTVRVLREAMLPVTLLGRGGAPQDMAGLEQLDDPPDVGGPLAGMIAALRAHPDAAWLIVGCDMPRISTSAIDWLLGQRGSAYSAILPSVSPGCAEPLLAIYEPAARAALDELAREPDASPRRLAGRPNVRTVIVPDDLRDAWTNVNTPDEWERERRRQPHGLA